MFANIIFLIFSLPLISMAQVLLKSPDLEARSFKTIMNQNEEFESFAYFQWKNRSEPNFQSDSIDMCLLQSEPEVCRLAETELLAHPLSNDSIQFLRSLPIKTNFLQNILVTYKYSPQASPQVEFLILKNGQIVGAEDLENISAEEFHWSIFTSDANAETFIGSAIQAKQRWLNRRPIVTGNCSEFYLEQQKGNFSGLVALSENCIRASSLAKSKEMHPSPFQEEQRYWHSLQPRNYLVPALVTTAIVLGYLRSQGKQIEFTWP